MRHFLLAVDYDGTLAKKGQVSQSTLTSLERLRATGRRLILVTGRRLDELKEVFNQISLFDRVVAENGALLYEPATDEEIILADPPPTEFARRLRASGVDRVETGRVIVATWQPHQHVALELIHQMGLELQIIFNKDAVMILPSGVNKAQGLKAALDSMHLSPVNVVAVGDAENDEAMLNYCAISAAVSNSLPSVKELADIILPHPRGRGVEWLIDKIIENDLHEFANREEHKLPLGERLDGSALSVAPYGESILITGGPGGGKSRLGVTFLEQLTQRGEQCCVIDPEGDYQQVGNGITVGTVHQTPAIDEVIEILENAQEHCIVSCFNLDKADRPAYFDRLQRALGGLRTRTGRPHWILVDEAHYAVPKDWHPAKRWSGSELHGMLFITAYHDRISDVVLKNVDWIVSIAENPETAISQCCQMMGARLPEFHPPSDRQEHKALAWRRGESCPHWFIRKHPQRARQRHAHSHYEGRLQQEDQFTFRGPADKLCLTVENLKEFIKIARGVDLESWDFHLKRHEFSRWLRESIQDPELADKVNRIESDEALSASRSRELVTELIHEQFAPRYT